MLRIIVRGPLSVRKMWNAIVRKYKLHYAPIPLIHSYQTVTGCDNLLYDIALETIQIDCAADSSSLLPQHDLALAYNSP